MTIDKFVNDTSMGILKKNSEEAKKLVAHLMLADPAVELMMARKKLKEALEGMGCTSEHADEVIEEELGRAAKAFAKWESTEPRGPKMKVFLGDVELTNHDEE